jgi:peroxiredoxin Q/BCP
MSNDKLLASVGKSLPYCSVASNKGQIDLKDYLGKYLVVYFYPKDNTPGCSIEAQDFKKLYAKFQEYNSDILGVSRDSLASHAKFECKYDLPFTLTADADSKICDMFDVIKKKSIFGKTALGLIRSTFLIDPSGVLIKEWRNVKVTNHAQEVLDTIIALEK